MKITDVQATILRQPTMDVSKADGSQDALLIRIETDEGITGHAFLGTSSNPASLDGPGLIRFLKPILMGQKYPFLSLSPFHRHLIQLVPCGPLPSNNRRTILSSFGS